MQTSYDIQEQFYKDGFAIIDNIFSHEEIDEILLAISQVDTSKPTFRKTTDLFAIRQFFKEVPAALAKVFVYKLNTLIAQVFGHGYFVVKSIYFDKPENSNWFVSYHQDLTISVDKKVYIEGYGPCISRADVFQMPCHRQCPTVACYRERTY